MTGYETFQNRKQNEKEFPIKNLISSFDIKFKICSDFKFYIRNEMNQGIAGSDNRWCYASVPWVDKKGIFCSTKEI